MTSYRNDSPIVLLSGGVGGARMARGLAAVCAKLTVVVNVGDDDVLHGLNVSPDLDTVMYTLAGIEGPEGWGVAGDRFTVMSHLAGLGIDTGFRIGDRDLATNLARTAWLRAGEPLSTVTARLARTLGVEARILPVTDEAVPTRIRTGTEWLTFQEYFVHRGSRPTVDEVSFEGASNAAPGPGVLDAIARADTVIIGPSNPALSVWPILAIPGIRPAVASARRVVAVSPLFGGHALKGPAARVMASLGLPPGSQGVADAYAGLISDLVVDTGDAGDEIETDAVVHALPTRIADPGAAAVLAGALLELS